MPATNRQRILTRRPQGAPVDEDFALAGGPMPEPGDGEFVTRNPILSVDPAQRGWKSGAARTGSTPARTCAPPSRTCPRFSAPCSTARTRAS